MIAKLNNELFYHVHLSEICYVECGVLDLIAIVHIIHVQGQCILWFVFNPLSIFF